MNLWIYVVCTPNFYIIFERQFIIEIRNSLKICYNSKRIFKRFLSGLIINYKCLFWILLWGSRQIRPFDMTTIKRTPYSLWKIKVLQAQLGLISAWKVETKSHNGTSIGVLPSPFIEQYSFEFVETMASILSDINLEGDFLVLYRTYIHYI